MARTSAPRKTATAVPAAGINAEVKPPAVSHAAPARPARPPIEQIRARAFEIYQSRCRAGKPGDAASDWAQAERELTQAAR
ncbi:MAG: DUF2934 domain-containing protein [Phycisphaeraceae bacterium]|nr:DUF2934 domain-containing protein [Phycisphaeraceae bacterium]